MLSQYDKLDAEKQAKLLDEILTLNFNQVEELFKKVNNVVDFNSSKIEPTEFTDKSAMTKEELITVLEQFYPKEKQEQYGVLGIRIELL